MAIKVDTDKCAGCGACTSICPVGAIEMKDGKAVISDACIECCECVAACTKRALKF